MGRVIWEAVRLATAVFFLAAVVAGALGVWAVRPWMFPLVALLWFPYLIPTAKRPVSEVSLVDARLEALAETFAADPREAWESIDWLEAEIDKILAGKPSVVDWVEQPISAGSVVPLPSAWAACERCAKPLLVEDGFAACCRACSAEVDEGGGVYYRARATYVDGYVVVTDKDGRKLWTDPGMPIRE